MSASEVVLSVLSFNIWGLPGWIAKDKDERIIAIGSYLRKMEDVDVICLQEVWIEKDYQLIRKALKTIMPYSHYFYSGVTGSGVCVFSKWPITDILFHQWPLNGYIHMIHHGDWFGGKGVGLVVLDVNGYRVNIYTTHLHAQYHEDDSYLVHRVEQAFDTAMFIKLTSGDAHFSALAGDLNTSPGSVCEQLLIHIADLKDSYEAHDEESKGGTNDCIRNTYSNPSMVSSIPDGLRIDYILYKASPKVQSKMINYTFPLDNKIPGKNFSFSDHEAILAKFSIKFDLNSSEKTIPQIDQGAFEKALSESISICTTALEDTNKKSTLYLTFAVSLFCCLLLEFLVFDQPVFNATIFFLILLFTIVLMVFFILMASMWCKLEYHGILGARDRMVVLLDTLKK